MSTATPIAAPGALDLAGVEFGYLSESEGGRAVLHGLDVHIPARQTVALVGATGAGKSTIANLIAWTKPPSSLDGADRTHRAARAGTAQRALGTGQRALATGQRALGTVLPERTALIIDHRLLTAEIAGCWCWPGAGIAGAAAPLTRHDL